MTPAAIGLLGLLASNAEPATLVRERLPDGVWFEPQLRFHSLGSGRADLAGSDMAALPLGLEVGRQVTSRLLLSLGVAHMPVQELRTTQVSAGARWYLLDGAIAPYAGGELGVLSVHVDDTGGQTHTDWFAVAGPGLEAGFGNGLSLTTDLAFGPENTGAVGTDERVWHFSAWVRIGLGWRF